MRLLRLPFAALLYFSVATVIAQLTVVGVLWSRGHLANDRLVQVMAIARNVDVVAMSQRIEASARSAEVEQVSFEDVIEARKLLSLDMDLREIAADKGLMDVRQWSRQVEQERQEYDSLKAGFDRQLTSVREGAIDEGLKEVQRQLESIDPKLAKDQLLRILGNDAITQETSLQFVVSMFKNMPLEKRKRILAEFKSPDEVKQLKEILDQIRLGVPDVDLIRETRKQFEAFNSRK